MITLITGLPGHGKTLFALWFIKKKAEKENREVFYHNIKDLNLPWTQYDAEKWMDLPPRSIMVIDEAQFIFSKKPNGSKLPDYYELLSTHRHLGIDIFLITQHPSLVDNHPRKLVDQHYHVVRKFGLERATIYQWSQTCDHPQNRAPQDGAISMKWGYPKEVYGYYKSAEVHTVKRSIPVKLVLFVLFALFVAAYVVYTFTSYGRKSEPVVSAESAVAPSVPFSVQAQGQGEAVAFDDPVRDAQRFVFDRTPRVEGLPETAPRYDGLTSPTRVPVPAMCIQRGSVRDGGPISCKCFTQQATPMDVGIEMCISIARNGRFMDFDPDPQRQQHDQIRAQQSAQVLERHPDVSMREPYGPAPVVAFNEVSQGMSQGVRPPGETDTGPPNPASRSALVRNRVQN